MIKEKETTIYDIAGRPNISLATGSRVIKDDPVVSKKTKKRSFEPAEEVNYRSNHFGRNLRNPKTEAIGVIVPRLNGSFMSSVIAGIESVVNSEGYNLIISHSSEDLKKEIACARTMSNNRVDGLLVSLSYDTEDLPHFNMSHKKNIPVIFFDRVVDQENYTNILIENKKSAVEATTHLIKQECKRIVHITAVPKQNVYRDEYNYTPVRDHITGIVTKIKM